MSHAFSRFVYFVFVDHTVENEQSPFQRITEYIKGKNYDFYKTLTLTTNERRVKIKKIEIEVDIYP
jgi:hypothetical protein